MTKRTRLPPRLRNAPQPCSNLHAAKATALLDQACAVHKYVCHSAPAVVCSVSGAPTTSQWGPCACAVDASTSAGDPLMCSSPISAEMV